MSDEKEVTELLQRHPLPWSYRPQKHDDWGFVRDASGGLVLSTCPSGLAQEFSEANPAFDDVRHAGPPQAKLLATILIDAANEAHATLTAAIAATDGGA